MTCKNAFVVPILQHLSLDKSQNLMEQNLKFVLAEFPTLSQAVMLNVHCTSRIENFSQVLVFTTKAHYSVDYCIE
jgi:hypothetical protein